MPIKIVINTLNVRNLGEKALLIEKLKCDTHNILTRSMSTFIINKFA